MALPISPREGRVGRKITLPTFQHMRKFPQLRRRACFYVDAELLEGSSLREYKIAEAAYLDEEWAQVYILSEHEQYLREHCPLPKQFKDFVLSQLNNVKAKNLQEAKTKGRPSTITRNEYLTKIIWLKNRLKENKRINVSLFHQWAKNELRFLEYLLTTYPTTLSFIEFGELYTQLQNGELASILENIEVIDIEEAYRKTKLLKSFKKWKNDILKEGHLEKKLENLELGWKSTLFRLWLLSSQKNNK